jgi:pimeloyl-ACP methyl ester carboxylesterase
MAPPPSTRRRSRAVRWLLIVGGLLAAAYVIGFGAYGFVAGSAEYLLGASEHAGCETPASRFGWSYEAINYDQADDARLLAANPDPTDCKSQGTTAGAEVVAADGVHLAGWYIPAAPGDPAPTGGSDPTAPTVLIVHGGKTNKSSMLPYAAPLHAAYNLVLVDLRNSGRSGPAGSTGGLHEQGDVRAVLDWLERVKHPSWVAVVGNSNGAAAALAEALDDQRVRALVLDSMHAAVERQIGNVIETERHLPAWPAAWGLVAGVSFRLGESLESVDPVRSIARVDARPVLLTHGLADIVDRPTDSLDLNVAAARGAGVNLEVHVCPGAGHGHVIDVCATDWAGWVQAFLAANGG